MNFGRWLVSIAGAILLFMFLPEHYAFLLAATILVGVALLNKNFAAEMGKLASIIKG